MRKTQYIGTAAVVILSVFLAHQLAARFAEYVFLRHHYGNTRVAKENLTVTYPGRAEVRVSNGEVLGRNDAKALGAIWLVAILPLFASFGTFFLLVLKRIAPWAVMPP